MSGAVHTVHVPLLQPQLAGVPSHALPLLQTGTTGTLQLLFPAAQPYAVRVGCWSEQTGTPVILQYSVQLADTQLLPHQTWPEEDE